MKDLKITIKNIYWDERIIGDIVDNTAHLYLSIDDLVSEFSFYEVQDIVKKIDKIIDNLVKQGYQLEVSRPSVMSFGELHREYTEAKKDLEFDFGEEEYG